MRIVCHFHADAEYDVFLLPGLQMEIRTAAVPGQLDDGWFVTSDMSTGYVEVEAGAEISDDGSFIC